MKAISLFSGIGGFELAMQRAGIERDLSWKPKTLKEIKEELTNKGYA